MFEEMDHAHLGKILDEQREIVEVCRKRSVKPPQVLLILDDLGDQGDVLASRRGGKSGGSWLTTLACRSRHLCLTWICSIQNLNQAGLTIRANTRCMCVWPQPQGNRDFGRGNEWILSEIRNYGSLYTRHLRAILLPFRAPRC